jgi:hypothetical protein
MLHLQLNYEIGEGGTDYYVQLLEVRLNGFIIMHFMRIISCSAEVKQIEHFTIKDPMISYLNCMTAQESIVTRENICVQ